MYSVGWLHRDLILQPQICGLLGANLAPEICGTLLAFIREQATEHALIQPEATTCVSDGVLAEVS